MKSKYLSEILNYENTVSVINSNNFQDASDSQYDPNDLCRDFGTWRSNTNGAIDIYIEISDSDALDCFSLLRTNLSQKAQVYVSGSNFSGIAAFADPTFVVQMTRRRNDWIYFSKTALPSSKYFKISIIDETPVTDHIEISKILCGKTKDFSLEIVDGWSDTKDSLQEREITDGQYRPGSEDSILTNVSVTFRSAAGSKTTKPNEWDLVYEMMTFVEIHKTTRPFLFIYNPDNAAQYFEYVTIKDDEIQIAQSDNDRTVFSFTFMELR